MWRNSKKLERVCGRVFLMLFLLTLPLVWVRLVVQGEKADGFDLEGRRAERVPTLTMKTFLDGTYQEQLEKALADQMPKSETIRTKYLSAKNEVFKNLSWLSIKADSNYRLVSDDNSVYKNHDYLVRNAVKKTRQTLDSYEPAIDKSAEYYGSLPIQKKFQYIVTNDSALDFDNMNYDLVDWLAAKYPMFQQAHLDIPDFETYMKYYLKNDHHWNYEGAYQGYKDIINLLLGAEEKLVEPAEKVVFNYSAKGSRSRYAFFTNFNENFTAYRFDLKEHDTYVNGAKTEYGHQQEYFTDETLRNGSGDITYGEFYGFDMETIEYDFKQPDKPNLVMIGYSDTNALNEVVASHFNRTWVFDTRFCNRENFEKILSENDIEYLLLVPNASSYIPAMPEDAKGYDS